ncbi:translocator protein [Neodiprion pinetum]|uniref:translocator protein n=1 Tax=Neodiprion pinetum TaxID=441929 RepID=UPI001EDF17FA|nr:translocator protein-like [Neodiprion pinetum]
MPIEIVWPAVGATILPNLGGWAGSLITTKNIKPWYETLRKPNWRPPNWAFGPVWTTLYCGMGYASYLVWRDGGGFEGDARYPLISYGINIGLNWAWTPIFFGAKSLKWSFYEILVLLGSTAVTTVAFFKVNETAGYLLIPYLAWGTLATALNYVVYRDNPAPAIEGKKD